MEHYKKATLVAFFVDKILRDSWQKVRTTPKQKFNVHTALYKQAKQDTTLFTATAVNTIPRWLARRSLWPTKYTILKGT